MATTEELYYSDISDDDTLQTKSQSQPELGPGVVSSGGTLSYSHEPNKKNSIYIGNLTWWTSAMDLIQVMTESGLGEVKSIKFYENQANGRSKGYALLELSSEQLAMAAQEKLQETIIYEQTPFVRYSYGIFPSNFETVCKATAGTFLFKGVSPTPTPGTPSGCVDMVISDGLSIGTGIECLPMMEDSVGVVLPSEGGGAGTKQWASTYTYPISSKRTYEATYTSECYRNQNFVKIPKLSCTISHDPQTPCIPTQTTSVQSSVVAELPVKWSAVNQPVRNLDPKHYELRKAIIQDFEKQSKVFALVHERIIQANPCLKPVVLDSLKTLLSELRDRTVDKFWKQVDETETIKCDFN